MRTRGHTLVELGITLVVLGIILAVALPPMGHWRDEAAVRAARSEIVAALHWTRVAAAGRDGAVLVLDPATGRLWTEWGSDREPATDLARRYGVRLETGSESPVRFVYDGLGIGRIASRTVRIHRGRAQAGLVVSAYGRVRPW